MVLCRVFKLWRFYKWNIRNQLFFFYLKKVERLIREMGKRRKILCFWEFYKVNFYLCLIFFCNYLIYIRIYRYIYIGCRKRLLVVVYFDDLNFRCIESQNCWIKREIIIICIFYFLDDLDIEFFLEIEDEQDDRMESDRSGDFFSDDYFILLNVDISDLMVENNFIRQYVFRFNFSVNVILNMVMVVVIFVVVGLGIGYVIGEYIFYKYVCFL